MKLFLHFQTLTLVLFLSVSALAQQPAPTLTRDQALQHYRDSKAPRCATISANSAGTAPPTPR